jgi:hypothetical protein
MDKDIELLCQIARKWGYGSEMAKLVERVFKQWVKFEGEKLTPADYFFNSQILSRGIIMTLQELDVRQDSEKLAGKLRDVWEQHKAGCFEFGRSVWREVYFDLFARFIHRPTQDEGRHIAAIYHHIDTADNAPGNIYEFYSDSFRANRKFLESDKRNLITRICLYLSDRPDEKLIQLMTDLKYLGRERMKIHYLRVTAEEFAEAPDIAFDMTHGIAHLLSVKVEKNNYSFSKGKLISNKEIVNDYRFKVNNLLDSRGISEWQLR